MSIPSEPSWLSAIQTAQQLIAACKTTQAEYAKGLIDVTRAAKDSSEWVKQGQSLAREAKETAATAKGVTDNLKQGKWQQIGGKMQSLAGAATVGAIIGLAIVQKVSNDNIANYIEGNEQRLKAEADAAARLLSGIVAFKNRFDARITALEKQTKINDSNQKTTGLRAQQAFTNSVDARELAQKSQKLGNDALYEARQGRKTLEGQIQKLAVDTATKITGLKQQYDAIIKQVGTSANNAIQQTIKQLQDTQQQANRTINDSTVKNQESIKKLTSDVQKTNITITALRSALQQTFNTTQSTIKAVVDKAVAPIAKASAPWGVTVTPATITPATVAISDGSAVTVTPAVVTPATVTPSMFSSSAIGQQVAQQIKQETSGTDAKINTLAGANSNLAQAISNVNADLQNTKKVLGKTYINTIDSGARLQIEQLRRENVEQVKQIQKLNTDLQSEQKMNLEGVQKLNNLLGTVNTIGIGVVGIKAVVDAIPTNTINGLKPQIPPLVEQGICNSTRGGCMKGALDQNANNIGNAVNAGNNDLWNKINAGLNGLGLGADGAAMVLLNNISTQIGNTTTQISTLADSVTSKFKKTWDFLGIDRIIALTTLWSSLHNTIMLSDNISQTFFGILDNVIAVPQLIINPEGQTINTREIFGSTIEGWMKGLLGVQEWEKLKEQWANWNRIYQSSANIVNNVRTIGSNISDSVQIVGKWTGELGNALQDEGLISEDNWDYKPEEPQIKSGFFAQVDKFNEGLENANETLNSIRTVTQNVRSIVETANQIKKEASDTKQLLDQSISEAVKLRDEAIEKIPTGLFTFTWEDLI